jgi:hypothetical protein
VSGKCRKVLENVFALEGLGIKEKPVFGLKIIFYTLLGIFIVLSSYIILPVPVSYKRAIFPFTVILAILFSLLGLALILVTLKLNVKGKLKKFLILTGASAIGIPISAILHNFIYGLCIHFFGKNFWDSIGLIDETFFFFLAIFVFPILFLIGMIGCIVMFVRNRRLD